jgi:hypothetical protein
MCHQSGTCSTEAHDNQTIATHNNAVNTQLRCKRVKELEEEVLHERSAKKTARRPGDARNHRNLAHRPGTLISN